VRAKLTQRAWLVIAALALTTTPSTAHESRPAYLSIQEVDAGLFDVLWKRPMLGDRVMPLSVTWPGACRAAVTGNGQQVPGAVIERQMIDCGSGGLVGRRILIDGLDRVSGDVLVRIGFAGGDAQTHVLKPAQPWVDVAGPRSSLSVAVDYFVLGVEHILGGLDHLLFVLGLTLIVRGAWLLVKTITAFTVAHSITLAMATLGHAAVPQAPVEAVIALSILFLASELARLNRGLPGLASRAPWLVAFSFGLLHGFGFAGALLEVGLPQSDIPLALLTFNIGVEAGQLAFIAAVLGIVWAGRRLIASPPRWAVQIPAYAIGSLATFWLIGRLAAF
jgi:hydrogenase/urease accessory protein HupE